MAAFDLDTTLRVVPLLLGITVLAVLFVRFVRKLFHRSRRLLAAITAHVTEYVQGIELPGVAALEQ